MSNHDFVFITGLHRSGTSPLHRCLRRHPQISGFENTGVAEDEGQHLQTILPRGGAYGGPGRFGRHPDVHMTETHPLANPATAEALFAQWSPYWDLSKPFLLEKTPITLLRTRLFQTLFPNSFFIVIVRHPAAVALATYNALVSLGIAQDLNPADLMEHWLLCHEMFLTDAPHLKRLCVVRYEDFVAKPQSTLDSLYTFLGVASYPLDEEIESDINDAYLAQWRSLHQDPQGQLAVEQAMALVPRIQALGYNLEDWHSREPCCHFVEGSNR